MSSPLDELDVMNGEAWIRKEQDTFVRQAGSDSRLPFLITFQSSFSLYEIIIALHEILIL